MMIRLGTQSIKQIQNVIGPLFIIRVRRGWGLLYALIGMITVNRGPCKHTPFILRMRFRVSDPITTMHKDCQQPNVILLSPLTTEN
jgi:hypothetical protein